MSDKETAPCPHVSLKRQNVGNQRWYKCLSCPQKFKAAEWDGKVTAIAAECTAPAPQPAEDWVKMAARDIAAELCFGAKPLLLVPTALEELIAERITRRAATPQVTPWQSHFTDSDATGDIHNYVDTGDGKRLWAQDADEIVKRHNDGTLEQAPHVCELELEQEADGRWLAELPGVAAYGPSKEEAIRNAAKVLIESEQAELVSVVERLANHGSVDDYTVAGIRAELRDALHNFKFKKD